MSWNWKSRGERRALRAAHLKALEAARESYQQHRHEAMVITTGSGPGYSFISAAEPGRIAWESYFYAMRDQGFSGWDTKRLFDRELKRWERARP